MGGSVGGVIAQSFLSFPFLSFPGEWISNVYVCMYVCVRRKSIMHDFGFFFSGLVVRLFLLTDRQRSWTGWTFISFDRQTDRQTDRQRSCRIQAPHDMGRSLREGGREGGRVRKVRYDMI